MASLVIAEHAHCRAAAGAHIDGTVEFQDRACREVDQAERVAREIANCEALAPRAHRQGARVGPGAVRERNRREHLVVSPLRGVERHQTLDRDHGLVAVLVVVLI